MPLAPEMDAFPDFICVPATAQIHNEFAPLGHLLRQKPTPQGEPQPLEAGLQPAADAPVGRRFITPVSFANHFDESSHLETTSSLYGPARRYEIVIAGYFGGGWLERTSWVLTITRLKPLP